MESRQYDSILHPEDGSQPFYASSEDRGADYDSDDEYTPDKEALRDFNMLTRRRMLWSRTQPDKRFMIKALKEQLSTTRLPRYGFATKDADTAISLSPDDEDLILVRSEMLAASHPFFRASFAARWPHNKLSHPVVIEGHTILYRYELEYYGDGTTALIGKKKPTPADERGWKICEAANNFRQSLYDRDTAYGMFDEYPLKAIATHAKDQAGRDLEFPMYGYICKSANYLALELLCGHPAKLYRRRPDVEEEGGGGGDEPNSAILILLKLMDWMHVYGSLNALGPQIERLVLGPKFGKKVLLHYPYTCLRIANMIQGKDLFRAALEYAVEEFDNPCYNRYELFTRGDDERSPNYLDSPEDLETNATEEYWERLKIEDLEEQLGYDLDLARAVTRMRELLLRHYTSLQDRIRSVQSALAHDSAGEMAKARDIWDTWVGGASTVQGMAQNVQSIALDYYTSQSLLDRYYMIGGRPSGDRKEPIDDLKLRQNLDALMSAAKAALGSINSCDEDQELSLRDAGGFNLAGQFVDYRYPWNIRRKKSTSRLSGIIEMPSVEE